MVFKKSSLFNCKNDIKTNPVATCCLTPERTIILNNATNNVKAKTNCLTFEENLYNMNPKGIKKISADTKRKKLKSVDSKETNFIYTINPGSRDSPLTYEASNKSHISPQE